MWTADVFSRKVSKATSLFTTVIYHSEKKYFIITKTPFNS